jgi:DNA-binding CsgD family transcriptional regulator
MPQGAADALRAGIATIDRGSAITWANDAWLRSAGNRTDPIAGAEIGANLLTICRSRRNPVAQALSIGVPPVLAGLRSSFEGEFDWVDDSPRWRFEATLLPRPDRGAVLLRLTIGTRAGGTATPPPDPAGMATTIDRLAPRERDVLRLMLRGLDNRQIAAELGLTYATVRSYARSLIKKLGARSRLQAVARAHHVGIASGQ